MLKNEENRLTIKNIQIMQGKSKKASINTQLKTILINYKHYIVVVWRISLQNTTKSIKAVEGRPLRELTNE